MSRRRGRRRALWPPRPTRRAATLRCLRRSAPDGCTRVSRVARSTQRDRDDGVAWCPHAGLKQPSASCRGASASPERRLRRCRGWSAVEGFGSAQGRRPVRRPPIACAVAVRIRCADQYSSSSAGGRAFEVTARTPLQRCAEVTAPLCRARSVSTRSRGCRHCIYRAMS